MNLFWAKMLTATDNARFINFNFIRVIEGNEFFFNCNVEFWEFIAGSLRPFKADLLKARILLCVLHVLAKIINVATDCAVDPCWRNQNAAF
jgi:hypothetical protein